MDTMATDANAPATASISLTKLLTIWNGETLALLRQTLNQFYKYIVYKNSYL